MRKIVQDGNPVLRRTAANIPLSEIKEKPIQKLIGEMKALLAKEDYGVALAAPQVGESLKLFIVSGKALARGRRNAPDEGSEEKGEDAIKEEEEEEEEALPDLVYINPELLKLSRQKTKKHEGCLSIRKKWGEVMRAEKATIRAYDENGVRFTRGASGFLAHIFQHEMDHLDGILYSDKATAIYDEQEERKQK